MAFNKNEDEKATMADVVEYPDRYEFVVNMPGIRPSEIKVLVVTLGNRNVLRVMSRVGEKEDMDEVKYLKRERHVGKFLLTFKIPWNADLDVISAVSKDGVVTVTIQKLHPVFTLIKVTAD